MGLGAGANLFLGVGFVAVGLIAAILQYWLWTFPMTPDPSGVDPNGVTTAPKTWRMVHRGLGYLFVLIYLVLMIGMVPRLWSYDSESWQPGQIAHAALGATIGVLLVAKVLILRRFQRLGNRLRMVGTLLLIFAVAAIGLVARPGFTLVRQSGSEDARAIVLRNCARCHGLSRVVNEDEDADKWHRILSEMREHARDRGFSDPTEGRQGQVALFLASLDSEEERRDDDDRKKPRGRDR